MTNRPTSPTDETPRKRSPRTAIKLLTLGSFVALFVVIVFLGCLEIRDPDFGQHVAYGRLLLEDFASVRHLTMGQAPEIVQYAYSYWLFQIMTAALFDNAGAGAIVLLRCLVLFATLLLVVLLAHRHRADGWACATGLLPVILISQERFLDRPELLSFLALIVALWILKLHRLRRAVWLLIPLQIVWVNTHLWFSLLPALFALFAVGDLIERRGGLRGAALIFGALIVSTFANPAGPLAWRSQLTVVRFIGESGHLPFAIQEMMSPYSSYQESPAVWVFRIAMPLSVLLIFLARRRLGWGPLLALGLATLLAVKARRAMPLFALTAGPLIPIALTDLRERLPRSLKSGLPVLLAAVVLVVGTLFSYGLLSGRYFMATDQDVRIALNLHPRFPALDAARFIREEKIEGPIFNNAVSAGAIVLENGPRLTPFLDARWVGTEETMQAYHAIRQASGETILSVWEDLARARGFETVLLDFYEMPALLRLLSADERWALVHLDETAALFCKRDGVNRSVVERAEPEVLAKRATRDPAREAALGEEVVRFLQSEKPSLFRSVEFPYSAFYRSNHAVQTGHPYDAQAAFLELLKNEDGSLHLSDHRIDILNNMLWSILNTDQNAAVAELSGVLAEIPEIDASRKVSLRLREARALERLGQGDRAEAIAKGITQDRTASGNQRWAAWCRIANVRSGREDYEGAVDALEEALRERPESAETYRSIGGILDLKLSRPEEALKAYDKYRSLGGADPAIENRISALRPD